MLIELEHICELLLVMFMDYFGLLSWIFEKNGLNHQKSGQAVRVLRSGVETHAAAKTHSKAWPKQRLVKPRVRRYASAKGFAAT